MSWLILVHFFVGFNRACNFIHLLVSASVHPIVVPFDIDDGDVLMYCEDGHIGFHSVHVRTYFRHCLSKCEIFLEPSVMLSCTKINFVM